MRLSSIALFAVLQTTSGFSPVSRVSQQRSLQLQGYLDDLSNEVYAPDPNPNPEEESREATQMDKKDVTNFGAGSWETYVEFNTFDGGDGQST